MASRRCLNLHAIDYSGGCTPFPHLNFNRASFPNLSEGCCPEGPLPGPAAPPATAGSRLGSSGPTRCWSSVTSHLEPGRRKGSKGGQSDPVGGGGTASAPRPSTSTLSWPHRQACLPANKGHTGLQALAFAFQQTLQ